MVFGRKKKKKVEVKEPVEEPEEPEEEAEQEEELPEPPKKTAAKKEEKIGSFSLDADEMALAVNALANSEEFKVYQQMVIGQQAAEIIAAYNKVIGGKSEIPSEDTEELPEPE